MERSYWQYLDWDSEFFRKRIARVTENQLTAEKIEAINQSCQAQEIDCLYYLADSADHQSIRIAEGDGYRFVDVRVTLEKQLKNSRWAEQKIPPVLIRGSYESDIPNLMAIARSGFHFTRFYNDPNFPPDLCDLMYEVWIEKSCRGYADIVLVAEVEARPAGFISCSVIGNTIGSIGLVGVNKDSQGKGLGFELLEASFDWFADQGVDCVKVVTQGSNLRALRLYQKNGFLISSIHLWFHKWYLQANRGN